MVMGLSTVSLHLNLYNLANPFVIDDEFVQIMKSK
jgi:hypothetical protein